MGKIIWLASYPRSGNIWLQSFLHNLLRNANHTPNAQELGAFCTLESSALHFVTPESQSLSTWTHEEIAMRRAEAHKEISETNSDNVFASTRSALLIHGGAPTITMEHTAAAVYVARNPLDVVVSLAAYHDQSIDQAIDQLAAEHNSENSNQFAYEHHGSWSSHVKSWTLQRHAGLHILRYEDMVSTPESAFAPLATFLGFDTTQERLARAIQFTSFAKLAAHSESVDGQGGAGNSAELFRKGTSDQWREFLSADQVRRIVERHGEQMQRFEYIPKHY